MWTFILGMMLSALPRHWREGARFEDGRFWAKPAALSGFFEGCLAILALVGWYSQSVTTWAAKALDSALRNGPSAQLPGQAIGFSALLLWVLHPLTWLIGYFALEGVVRMLAAAFAGQIVATLPLVILDWLYGRATGRAPEGDRLHVPSGVEQLRSFVKVVKDRVVASRSAELADELLESAAGGEKFLEIRASREKSEWIAPKTVRIRDSYFRLEEAASGSSPRPFVYKLRKLSAGVPGRTVIVYEPPISGDRGGEEPGT